jgi:hypothetical protein
MPDPRPRACSRCGRASDPGTKCSSCGTPLCHYDTRTLDGRDILCQRRYEDLTCQYHSRECDISLAGGGRP